jgi:hypothetical protein
LFDEAQIAELLAEATETSGPTLGVATHGVIPPTLAPPELLAPLEEFLAAHPFELNVFGMTRFPDEALSEELGDPVDQALGVARGACEEHGLELHFASDRSMSDDLWTNVAAHIWASRFGIAFFEDRVKAGLNYNLTIEVGAMILSGRRTALLKDTSVARLPTDLVGRIYRSVDLDDLDSVSQAIHGWLVNDLGFPKCGRCP